LLHQEDELNDFEKLMSDIEAVDTETGKFKHSIGVEGGLGSAYQKWQFVA
jgi:hypothetical protein